MWQRFWEKLKNLGAGLLALTYVLTVLFCGWTVASLSIKIEKWWFDAISYASYAIAAVSLAYSVYTLIKILPKKYRAAKDKLRQNRFIGKLMENYGLRTVIFGAVSTVITLAYSVYNAVIAGINHSLWYGALAVYYVLLLFMRGGIVLYHGKYRGKERKKELEIRKYRTCGISLMVTILALSATILEMVAHSAAFERAGMMIYVVAMYTFYKVVMSIINFVKAKKQDDYTVDALRNINVADAAVSLLALQGSMIQTFSDGGMGYMNALTGAAVCLLVFALGLYMVINSFRIKKKLVAKSVEGEELSEENSEENGK